MIGYLDVDLSLKGFTFFATLSPANKQELMLDGLWFEKNAAADSQ